MLQRQSAPSCVQLPSITKEVRIHNGWCERHTTNMPRRIHDDVPGAAAAMKQHLGLGGQSSRHLGLRQQRLEPRWRPNFQQCVLLYHSLFIFDVLPRDVTRVM